MAVSRKPAKVPVVTKPVVPKPARSLSVVSKPRKMMEATMSEAQRIPETVAEAQTSPVAIAEAVQAMADQTMANQTAISQAMASPVANLQEMLRLTTEGTLERSKLAYERLRSSAEETTETLEDAFKRASDGSAALSGKTIDLWRANANAFFDLAKSLTEVKSVSEAVALQTEFARKQFETLTAQTKEFSGLVQKVVADTTAPLNAATRTFRAPGA